MEVRDKLVKSVHILEGIRPCCTLAPNRTATTPASGQLDDCSSTSAVPRPPQAMAQPQAYNQAFVQPNKGTLIPGQTIAVNKYTVQVERYLSQGGFAHVYLVRTATPVYGTTHHVLKRIAVPTEIMLTEVKKEVDIMRILKGHPNIVHLIDAAWHRLPDGTYEVFILMEFCPGGGIIDMMNRRLRERLTEPEILTIFVDVCEGLGAMHALKPPLLHRDLKVENILQSSPNSYKLCDFGSTTPVQKVPSNMQELRALEADLNRHTTLQYRAPEMVDVYQRRPIDEKSDVWALGVLLYKLCYYTTPFEEHGPLAILNVQYKIPPYPVYSPQMNALIGSMLREHGAQRPTIFEILNHVHSLRGTRSQFTYNIPPKQPPVSPRTLQGAPLQALSPNIVSPPTSLANPLDDLVLFKSRSAQPTPVSAKNVGVEARDKVMEAIAPMRRGRPAQTPGVPEPSSSPRKEKERSAQNFALDMKFGDEEDRAWKGVRGHKSGMASIGGGTTVNLNTGGDAWGLSSKDGPRDNDSKRKTVKGGFESDFSSSFGKAFGDAFEPSRSPMLSSSPAKSQPIQVSRPSPSPNSSDTSSKSRSQTRDAFDGLGLATQAPQPQTLGDARRSRPGLTTPGHSTGSNVQPTGQYLNVGIGSSNTSYRSPSAHSPASSPALTAQSQRSHSPAIQPASWRSQNKPPQIPRPEMSAEERFPSLEEIDRNFASPPLDQTASLVHVDTQPASTERVHSKPTGTGRPPSRTAVTPAGARTGNLLGISGAGASASANHGRHDGVRSQHSTGTAMRESRLGSSRQQSVSSWERAAEVKDAALSKAAHPTRPVQPRRHRSSIAVRQVTESVGSSDVLSPSLGPSRDFQSPPTLPPRPSPRPEPRDWLTGMSDDESASVPAAEPTSQPVLRSSPSKRASYIERSPLQIHKALEAENVETTPSVTYAAEREIERERQRDKERAREESRERERAQLREREQQKERDLIKQQEHEREKQRESARERERERKEVKGRRSPTKTTKAYSRPNTTGLGPSRGVPLPGLEVRTALPVAPSPSGLTENWSPVSSPEGPVSNRSLSSSPDEGPEDLNGYVPEGGTQEKTNELQKVKEQDRRSPSKNEGSRRRRTRSKSRQNSVHDLVDLWGGPQPERDKNISPTKLADKRRSAIVSSSLMRPPPSPSFPRAVSPKPIVAPTPVIPFLPPSPSPAPPATTSRILPRPPSSQQHRKQPAVVSPPISNSASSPSAISVRSPVSARSRPQSLFINPVSRTAPLESNVTSLHASNSSSQQQPAQTSNSTAGLSRRSTRRTSISDMVQRYEAINGNVRHGAAPPPAVAAKPPALSVRALSSDASSAGVPSPSAAATRFPRLSPTSSPVQTKAVLAISDDVASGHREIRGRSSPIPQTATGLSFRPTATPIRPLKHATTGNNTDRLPARRSPEPIRENDPTSSEPSGAKRKPSPPGENDGRSSSPEKPYLGVSKLIDRWQRVAADSGVGATNRGAAYGGFVPTKTGTANTSLRGR